MNYIINPMWFYWISVVDGIKGALICSLILSMVISFTFFTIIMVDYRDEAYNPEAWCVSESTITEYKMFRKYLIISVIVLAVSAIGLIFIPSKNTLIEMQIAKYATYENAEISVESIKSAVDYIVNAIKGAGK